MWPRARGLPENPPAPPRRYCSACQSDMPLEGGREKPVMGGRSFRFVCRLCLERTKNRTRSGTIGKAVR